MEKLSTLPFSSFSHPTPFPTAVQTFRRSLPCDQLNNISLHSRSLHHPWLSSSLWSPRPVTKGIDREPPPATVMCQTIFGVVANDGRTNRSGWSQATQLSLCSRRVLHSILLLNLALKDINLHNVDKIMIATEYDIVLCWNCYLCTY